MAATSLTNGTANSTACSTPACAALANAILGDIDLNVDPCSDFYQYTCKCVSCVLDQRVLIPMQSRRKLACKDHYS